MAICETSPRSPTRAPFLAGYESCRHAAIHRRASYVVSWFALVRASDLAARSRYVNRSAGYEPAAADDRHIERGEYQNRTPRDARVSLGTGGAARRTTPDHGEAGTTAHLRERATVRSGGRRAGRS